MSTSPVYPLPVPLGILASGVNLVNTPTVPFVPGKAVKRWAYPAAAALPPTQLITFFKFDPTTVSEVAFQVAAGDAVVDNIPMIYSEYQPAPTPATLTITRVGTTPLTLNVPANSLSTADQATALAQEISTALAGPLNGAPLVATVQGIPPGEQFNANGETRQQWVLSGGGILPANVGNLIASQNMEGIGAPGSWSLVNHTLQWVSDPIPTPNAQTPPDMPYPVRPLLAGVESFQAGGPFQIFEVVSSASFDPNAPLTAGTGAQILTALQKIETFLGLV